MKLKISAETSTARLASQTDKAKNRAIRSALDSLASQQRTRSQRAVDETAEDERAPLPDDQRKRRS